MNVSTHIDMTLVVLEALGWKGDVKRAARSASYPDEVRAIEVEGIGAHVMGHNLASLAHFVVPYGNGKFGGYCWATDRSVPHLDLTNRKVKPNPGAWEFPVIEPFRSREPLTQLVEDLTRPGHKGSIEADQITYPAASIMAEWVFSIFKVWARDSGSERRQEALDRLCGWMMHLAVQDPVVPHHAAGMVLGGHAAFEADVDEYWGRMRADGRAKGLVEAFVKGSGGPEGPGARGVRGPEGTVRGIAEDCAEDASRCAKRLRWCWWWSRWGREVQRCIERGVAGSVRLGRLLLGVT